MGTTLPKLISLFVVDVLDNNNNNKKNNIITVDVSVKLNSSVVM